MAIKKGSSVHSDTDLNDLHREVTLLGGLGLGLLALALPNPNPDPQQVTLLGGCSHPHLLPLLGHCLAREAPCLVF